MELWLERQLRLAERQGLLRGRRLSEVQTFGLELLSYADHIAAGSDQVNELRLALIASGQYDPQVLLPGNSRVMEAQDTRRGLTGPLAATEDSEEVEDYSEVEWQAPADVGETEVMNDLEMFQRAMAENASVTVSEDGGEWL